MNTHSIAPYTYDPDDKDGIISFHRWLMMHPSCDFSDAVWNIIFRALRLSERAHTGQIRKSNHAPYITHPIQIIQNYLSTYPKQDISHLDIIVLALHDVIEDHPEYWEVIYLKCWLQIFRDVLVLTTGRLSSGTRDRIWERMSLDHSDWIEEQRDDSPSLTIMRILNPASPIFKLHTQSQYSKKLESQETQYISNAISYYCRKLLEMSEKDTRDWIYPESKAPTEYPGLGNYLYFSLADARRKTLDMLHNMSDMEAMEKKKKWYIAKRRIKAYILGVKLKNYGLMSEYNALVSAFEQVGYTMLSDSEVIEYLRSIDQNI